MKIRKETCEKRRKVAKFSQGIESYFKVRGNIPEMFSNRIQT